MDKKCENENIWYSTSAGLVPKHFFIVFQSLISSNECIFELKFRSAMKKNAMAPRQRTMKTRPCIYFKITMVPVPPQGAV